MTGVLNQQLCSEDKKAVRAWFPYCCPRKRKTPPGGEPGGVYPRGRAGWGLVGCFGILTSGYAEMQPESDIANQYSLWEYCYIRLLILRLPWYNLLRCLPVTKASSLPTLVL